MVQRTLNLGILAHVDAGKTTLTERLLYAAGVIDELGSVDAGTTQTDSLALEQQRGITIKSAVVSFAIGDVTVNLIDTPGHPDFIAEVERVLSVLDGAVLVISAVEGLQAQTRVLMRALQRLRIPTLLFVNKIDRRGSRCDRVLEDIAERLTPAAIAMGSVSGEGTRTAAGAAHADDDASFASRLVDLLAEHDDALLARYVDDETSVSPAELREELAAQTGRALVHPVFAGSAITGAGVDSLIAGITELLPAAEGDVDGPVSGSVFKVERGAAGEKIAYARLFSGTIRVRDRLQFERDELEEDEEAKVTAISVFDRGLAVRNTSAGAGQICKLWGLGDVRIGDVIGRPSARRSTQPSFAPPTMETVVVPRSRADKGALHTALVQLAAQDPLINLRQDDIRQELFVSLYGEVQKEVIQETLATDFGVDVEFRETTLICIERVVGSGEAVESIGADNPFLATIGLRIDPAPIDTGLEFRLQVGIRSVPLYVYKTVEAFSHALEETVRTTLQQGLHGWQVTDCIVTLTDSGYASPLSTAGDFRKLMPLVLMTALQKAGTEVCEPIHRFQLDGPADSLRPTMRVLAQLCAEPQTLTMSGSSFALEGDIAAARTHLLHQQLQALTHGEGVLEFAFDHYRPVSGTVPARPRSDLNPLNREEYLMHLARRA